MSNRGNEYSRMKKGESKQCLAAVQSLADTKGRGKKIGKMQGKGEAPKATVRLYKVMGMGARQAARAGS